MVGRIALRCEIARYVKLHDVREARCKSTGAGRGGAECAEKDSRWAWEGLAMIIPLGAKGKARLPYAQLSTRKGDARAERFWKLNWVFVGIAIAVITSALWTFVRLFVS